MTAEEYMERLYKALLIYFGSAGSPLPMRTGGKVETQNIYAGREGCLRLAREFGAGLKDYAKEERERVMKESYSFLCVRLYNLRPPVDAKEWAKEIMKVWEGDKHESI